MKATVGITTLGLIFSGTVALGQDNECFAEGSSFDVCESAKRLQEEAAPELPMTVSSDLIMDAVVAVGPEVTFGVRWKSNWEQLQAKMVLNNKDVDALSEELQRNADNAVCSSKVMRAFVTLGGQIAYAYRSSDGFNFFTARVAECEAN